MACALIVFWGLLRRELLRDRKADGASGFDGEGCAGFIDAALKDIVQQPSVLVVQAEVVGFFHHVEGITIITNQVGRRNCGVHK